MKSYGQDTDFTDVCIVSLTLKNMTLGQDHDTPLGLGQQLCEKLSKSNIIVVSYSLDKGHDLCVD